MKVVTERIEIQAPGGAMPTMVAKPEGVGPWPSVVVLMEAFGLVPHIEDVAQRIAAEGYVVATPDVYYRHLPDNKFGYDELDAAIGVMSKLDDGEFLGDMRATVASLNARGDTNGKVGVTGFCMGGRLTFLSACALSGDIHCGAPFYGGGMVAHLGQAGGIAVPLQLFFGSADPYIPNDQVDQIRATLGELGKDAAVQVYEGCDHGFFCNERPSYDEAAASDSWQKLTAFFARHLR